MARKTIPALPATIAPLASDDLIIIEKADGSGTAKISYEELIKAIAETMITASNSVSDDLHSVNAKELNPNISGSLQAQINALSTAFRYKGTKSTYAQVSSLSDMVVGDIWFVSEDNSEYAYNGSSWEKLGTTIDLTGYLTSVEIAGLSLSSESTTISTNDLKTALGLGTAAYAATATSVGNNINLPTGSAVKTFVEGKGYTTNTGTVTRITAGTGLAGGDVVTTGTIKANLKSETKSTLDSAAMGSTASRQYAVGVDKSGYLSVNVPWTDNNTTYSLATTSANGLMASGDKAKVNSMNVFYGTCSTAAATAAKVISLTNGTNFALSAGAIIGVKFTNTNTASNVTFNVDSKGAKSLYYNNAAYTGNSSSVCGTANRLHYYMYDGTYWVFLSNGILDSDTIPSAYCTTAAATAAKVASCSGYALLSKSYIQVIITAANTYAGAITLNINGRGAKPIYINGAASSSTNYTLPAGSYFVYYNGTNYYFRTDGKLEGVGLAGTPTAPTAAAGTNTTQIATTAFVTTAVANQCGVRTGISNSKYGYYKNDGTFVAFRSPTGTATAAQVLSGYSFSNASSDGLNGSMTNNNAVNATVARNSSYTIPAGYHNGSGKVTSAANSGTTTPSFTAPIYNKSSSVDLGAAGAYRYVDTINYMQAATDNALTKGFQKIFHSMNMFAAASSHPSISVRVTSKSIRARINVYCGMRVCDSSKLISVRLTVTNTTEGTKTKTLTQTSSNLTETISETFDMAVNTNSTITFEETAGDLGSGVAFNRTSTIIILYTPRYPGDVLTTNPDTNIPTATKL